MLQIPSSGFARSIGTHNGKLDVQADWVEASVLFGGDTATRSEIVDALRENQSYDDQDFANQWVGNIMVELERRFKLLGEAGALVREGSRIRRKCDWHDKPAYSFCVMLGILPLYRQAITNKCGANYIDQGLLFEQLIAESLIAMRWDVHQVGWSRCSSRSVNDKVDALAAAIGEPAYAGAIGRWTVPRAKDAGLDIVAWQNFPDGWGGRPICLVQCASGEDWTEKLHTPQINQWTKLIDFTTTPRRALAMPFAPGADHFRRSANSDLLVLLMDRHRLLLPGSLDADAFPSKTLENKLRKWTKKRVSALPMDAAG